MFDIVKHYRHFDSEGLKVEPGGPDLHLASLRAKSLDSFGRYVYFAVDGHFKRLNSLSNFCLLIGW